MVAHSALINLNGEDAPVSASVEPTLEACPEPNSEPNAEPSAEATRAEAIVHRIKKDPERGAALLFDAYASEVNQLIWRLLGADPDHDDFVQHVFYTVIAQVDTLREPRKLRHWVQAVTVNTIYGELRKRQVRRLFLAHQPNEQRLGDLTQDVEARDLLMRARGLLRRLPAKEQLVFLLHHVEGYTLSEVSELAGFSLATAKRRLSSANARFKKMAKREPGLELMVGAHPAETAL